MCTNVLARGVNLPAVEVVINFHLPNTNLLCPTEYVHRLGRTARMGNVGVAYSFFNQVEDGEIAGYLKKVSALLLSVED